MRIEIAGALATGKTTLCNRLEAEGFAIVREDLQSNPYLELRRADPETYEHLCQKWFVEEKCRQIAEASGDGLKVVDYCLAVERAYFAYYLEAGLRDAFNRRIEDCYLRFGHPDLVVYLRSRPETQLERIRTRGRPFEQGHDGAFISKINALVDEQVESLRRAGSEVFETWVDTPEGRAAILGMSSFLKARAGLSRAA